MHFRLLGDVTFGGNGRHRRASASVEQCKRWPGRAAGILARMVQDKFGDVFEDDQLCVATVVDLRFKLVPFDRVASAQWKPPSVRWRR